MANIDWSKASIPTPDPARVQPKRDFMEPDRMITVLPVVKPPEKDIMTRLQETLVKLKQDRAQREREIRAQRHQKRQAEQRAQKADRDRAAAEAAKLLKR